MYRKAFVQFTLTLAMAGLALTITWATLGIGIVQAQDPDTWAKADLYGAQVELEDFAMAANGDLYVCLEDVGYGVYQLLEGATAWQVLTNTGDGCRSMVIDNTNNGLYRLADRGDLWHSDDKGLNWTKIYTVSGTPWGSGVLAINPLTPTVLHMTLHQYGSGGTYTETVHYSENSGSDWTQAQFSLDGGPTYVDTLDETVREIVVDPTNPRYVYFSAGSHRNGNDVGLYASSNDGISYTRVITADVWDLGVNATPTGTVFAIYEGSLQRSADHGQSWSEIDPPSIEPACDGDGPNRLSFHPTLSRTLFLDMGGGTICRSDDEGDNWHVSSNTYCALPVFDPTDPLTWFAPCTPGVWKTADGGSTWTDFNEGLSEVDVRRIATSPGDNDRYWVMTGNGVGFTEDGGQSWKFPLAHGEQPFESIDEYILASSGGRVVFDPANHDRVYLAQLDHLYIFEDWTTSAGSGSWMITPTHVVTINAAKPDLRAQDLVIDPTNPLTGYLGAGNRSEDYVNDGDGVYKTTDRGLTWQTTSLTLPVRSMALVTHTGGVTVYAGTMHSDDVPGRIYRSADGGSSWQMMKELADPDRSVTTMAVDPRQPLQVFAGAAGNGGVSDSFFYISQDGGENWSLADFGEYQPGCGGWVADIAIDSKNPDHVYFTQDTNGNLCHSRDGGQTWGLPLFIWSQQYGVGQANVVDINNLPPAASGSGLSVQANQTVTQSLMYMGATSGIYSRILEDRIYYFPLIFKDSP